MTREDALFLIKQYIKNENSIKHMIASEAIMRSLAFRFNKNQDKWGLTGLLHDLDMEIVDYKSDPRDHGIKTAEILSDYGIDLEIIESIKAHNKATGKNPESLMDKSMYCTDPLTGLIVAGVLVSPSKKIDDLEVESVLKRFKEKAFARGADRDIILSCLNIGLPLEEFIKIGLDAMKSVNNDLGL